MYEKLINKKSCAEELRQIEKDIDRTYADEPYFKSQEGRSILSRLLITFSKHSSSVGYI